MADLAPSFRSGQNLNNVESQLELLLFDLNGGQLFGINVFRVSEALPCPKLSQLPSTSDYLIGIAYMRGTNIPVIDLSKAIGFHQNVATGNASIIVCELNNKIYGFLVNNIRQIVTIPWNEVSPPPSMLEKSCCLSSIVRLDDKHTVEVIDVEHVLEIVDPTPKGRYDEVDWVQRDELKGVQVLIVEDSKIARRHITEFLDYIGVVYTIAENGHEALSIVKEWGSSSEGVLDNLTAVISDVEMPIMDGLSLIKEFRKDRRLDSIAFYFHSTLAQLINKQLVSEVKATAIIEQGDYQSLLSEMRSYLNFCAEDRITA